MSRNEYHFITRWRVKGDAQDVFDILSDAAALPVWWPAVYLEARVIEPGDPANHGAGQLISLRTKGFLPYTLRWQFRVVEVAPPRRIVLEPSGDFTGRGEWTLAQDGEWVDITYDWNVTAHKPLLRSLSLVLRPAFAANHRWAMRAGERSLNIELARRRAAVPDQDAEIEEPPQPTTESVVPLTIAMSGIWLGLGLLGVVVLRWLRRRKS